MELLPNQRKMSPLNPLATRVSVCCTAQANRKKLKPFIVFGNVKRESKGLKDEFDHKCAIKSSPNAWMNEGLTVEWVQSVLGTFSFKRRLLGWDSFDLTDDVKKALKLCKTYTAIIPGGCTNFIEPPDVSSNPLNFMRLRSMINGWQTAYTSTQVLAK